MSLTESRRIQMLEPPTGKVTAVLDTDTYNEIDDQFALTYSILAENIDLKAVYAAPFDNNRSSGAGDGMEKSYEEILRVLDRLGVSPDGLVFKGSDTFMTGAETPVESEAARDLVKKSHETDGILYVMAIGAITNVASAILMDPTIIEKIVVVWLGGQPLEHSTAHEFNLKQDPFASQLMFSSGVPLVHLPCRNVTEMLRTTKAEVEYYLKGKNPISDYLCEIYVDYCPDKTGYSKVIWDIAAVAWLLIPGAVDTELVHSPVLTDALTWSFNNQNHFIRTATHINRDKVFGDLFGLIVNLKAE